MDDWMDGWMHDAGVVHAYICRQRAGERKHACMHTYIHTYILIYIYNYLLI